MAATPTPPVSSGATTSPLDNIDLGEPPADWKGWSSHMMLKLLIYVAKDPWGFLITVLLVLSPLLLLSAYCAYRLAQDIKRQEREQKTKAKRSAAIAKNRKQAKVD